MDASSSAKNYVNVNVPLSTEGRRALRSRHDGSLTSIVERQDLFNCRRMQTKKNRRPIGAGGGLQGQPTSGQTTKFKRPDPYAIPQAERQQKTLFGATAKLCLKSSP